MGNILQLAILQSGIRESNPFFNLGKVALNRSTNPAGDMTYYKERIKKIKRAC